MHSEYVNKKHLEEAIRMPRNKTELSMKWHSPGHVTIAAKAVVYVLAFLSVFSKSTSG